MARWRNAIVVLPSLGAALTLGTASAHAQYTPITFTAPVKLTQFAECGGYEPGVLVDKYGNIWVTAHKQNQCDGVAFDPQQTPPARAQSWVWTSTDGVNFTDAPGIAAGTVSVNAQSFDVGDEGDLAQDDSGNVYFVDTKVADNSFTSWHDSGLGQIALTFHTAAMGTAQPVDDRPWITAHGNGVVMYAGNMGQAGVYTSPNGNGSGRITEYMSYNGGQLTTSFDHFGITIPSSGWCRPAADHRTGSTLLYLVCTDDNSNVFAYVSTDDGHTAAGWHSYPICTGCATQNYWPVVTVDKNGVVYALITDSGSGGTNFKNVFYRSLDSGQTWTSWDATPQTGTIAANAGPAWFDVAPDGSIGLDYYLLPPGATNWEIEAGTSPGWQQPFTMVNVAPNMPPGSTSTVSPWGDFLECAFGSDSRLHVVWTDAAINTTLGAAGLNSDIFYSEEALQNQAAVPETPGAPLIALIGFVGVAGLGLTRRRRANHTEA